MTSAQIQEQARAAVAERMAQIRRLARRSERAEARGDFARAAALLVEIARLVGGCAVGVRQLSVEEAAREAGVCRATMYTLIRRGDIAHARVGNSMRVSSRDLETYLASRSSTSWRRVDRRGRPRTRSV